MHHFIHLYSYPDASTLANRVESILHKHIYVLCNIYNTYILLLLLILLSLATQIKNEDSLSFRELLLQSCDRGLQLLDFINEAVLHLQTITIKGEKTSNAISDTSAAI